MPISVVFLKLITDIVEAHSDYGRMVAGWNCCVETVVLVVNVTDREFSIVKCAMKLVCMCEGKLNKLSK